VTLIHKDRSTSITGYVLTVNEEHYMVILDEKQGLVTEVKEIIFEYK
jgi:hypothetical protein